MAPRRLLGRIDRIMAEAGQYASTIRMGGLVRSIATDIAVPTVAYYAARAVGARPMAALLTATAVAAARAIHLTVKHRHLDAIAGVTAVMFAAGFALSFVTGDPRFMLAKGAALGIAWGLIMLGSSLVGRPLPYAVSARLAHADRSAQTSLRRGWEQSRSFQFGFHVMAWVWGLGAIAAAAIQLWVAYHCDLDAAVGVNTAVGLGANALLIGWQVGLVSRSRALARRAGHLREP